MTIIEKEIAKREALIEEKAEKEAKLEALKAEAAALEADIANTDTEVLQAEVDELKTYLPQPEQAAPEAETEITDNGDGVAQEETASDVATEVSNSLF